jgi:hypothetical protein
MAQWPMHHRHSVGLFDVVPPHRRSRRTVVSTLLNNRWVQDLVGSLTLSVLIQYLSLRLMAWLWVPKFPITLSGNGAPQENTQAAQLINPCSWTMAFQLFLRVAPVSWSLESWILCTLQPSCRVN